MAGRPDLLSAWLEQHLPVVERLTFDARADSPYDEPDTTSSKRNQLRHPCRCEAIRTRRPRIGWTAAVACAGSTVYKNPGEPNERWVVNRATWRSWWRGSQRAFVTLSRVCAACATSNNKVSNPVTHDAEPTTGEQPAVEQFVVEGSTIDAPDGSLSNRAEPVNERARLAGQDTGTVSAVHVTMDRAGADRIDAQSVSLEQSGARSVAAKDVSLNQSGIAIARAEHLELKQSSIVMAHAGKLSLSESSLMLGATDALTIEDNVRAGALVAGTVEAEGDVRAGLLIAGNINAGGNVHVTFTAVSAAAFGIASTVTAVALRRLFRR